MRRKLLAMFVALSVLPASTARAQAGDGSLRGYVKDEQGGVLRAYACT